MMLPRFCKNAEAMKKKDEQAGKEGNSHKAFKKQEDLLREN